MKVRAPSSDSRYFDVRKLIHGASLHTICEEARCPNIAECWGRGTATFQILGDTCTRACRYCYVHSGKPESPPDPLEPLRLAQTAAQMGLEHVVVTSVDRDDVPDRGAGHYAATIRALKRKLPGVSVEVLTPDFLGVEEDALRTVLAERPDVFNHNIETVRRLHPRMRGAKASYDKALWLLGRAKELADYPVLTKSGIIVGLGETNDEVVETMHDLREHGVDVVTIGQYLQPSPQHAAIDRWVHPDEFRWFREQGEALGFGSVFSGPLVRSSYRADEQRHAAETGPRRSRLLAARYRKQSMVWSSTRPPPASARSRSSARRSGNRGASAPSTSPVTRPSPPGSPRAYATCSASGSPPTNDQRSSTGSSCSSQAPAFEIADSTFSRLRTIPGSASSCLGVEPRDPLGVEAGEGATVALALVQDRRPRQPGLRALEHEQLEQVASVARGDAPLLVVVGDIERISLRHPGATRRHPSIETEGAARRRPLRSS